VSFSSGLMLMLAAVIFATGIALRSKLKVVMTVYCVRRRPSEKLASDPSLSSTTSRALGVVGSTNGQVATSDSPCWVNEPTASGSQEILAAQDDLGNQMRGHNLRQTTDSSIELTDSTTDLPHVSTRRAPSRIPSLPHARFKRDRLGKPARLRDADGGVDLE